MIYRLRYLPDTVTDREELREYLSQYYAGTVRRLFALLKKSAARLKKWPYSCPVYEDDPDYRKLVVGDYLVFYMVNEDEKTVDIHRIFHGTRDIRRHLARSGQPTVTEDTAPTDPQEWQQYQQN